MKHGSGRRSPHEGDTYSKSALGIIESKSGASKTSHLRKRFASQQRTSHNSPKAKYMLSVEETVRLGNKKLNYTGKLDYDIKKWHHDINRPIVYGIHKDKFGKPRHFLDDTLRSKKIVPSPNTYDTSKSFLMKQNMMYNKSPRITMAVEIEKTQKKNAFPEPASYKPQMKYVENRTLGCFNF